MAADVYGLEEKGDESPWCVQCANFLKWPYHDECIGCLTGGGRPAETVSLRTVHWDVAVLHAVIRRKVAVWEQRHPGWELQIDMQRYWEDSTHPSRYVDRETGIGRKMAWTRFRVERTHPRGVRRMGQVVAPRRLVEIGTQGLVCVEEAAGFRWARPIWTAPVPLALVAPRAGEPPAPPEPPAPDDVPEPEEPAPVPAEEEEKPA
jgi:hypothetical protein